MMMMSVFTTALLDAGESFYDDFTSPSNDLNTSNWLWWESLTGASYTVSSGEFYAIGGALSHHGGISLINEDLNINAKDNDFSVEMRIKGGGGTTKLYWLQKGFYIADSSNGIYSNTAHLRPNLYGGGTSTDEYRLEEDINVSDSWSYQSSSSYSQLSSSYRIYKFIKTDTNVEFILDGVSQYNQTLEHIWNDDNDNIADNISFLSLFTAQHNYVPFYIDWINVTNLDTPQEPVEEITGFVAQYEETNIAEAGIDVIVKLILSLGTLMVIVIFTIIGSWAYGKVIKK